MSIILYDKSCRHSKKVEILEAQKAWKEKTCKWSYSCFKTTNKCVVAYWVSIPLPLITPSELVVSFPLTSYLQGPILIVEKHKHWVLKSISNRLTCFKNVITLLHAISSSRVCRGNAVADLHEVECQRRRNFSGSCSSRVYTVGVLNKQIKLVWIHLSSEMSSKKVWSAINHFRHFVTNWRSDKVVWSLDQGKKSKKLKRISKQIRRKPKKSMRQWKKLLMTRRSRG